ncbi:acetyltransferase [Mumia sp. zg.B53]|uniref:GNAT family N-acetyltransferase n=1 Tax=Mumia sp. zg.B53 TaxID=2855449 RepID=UPI001C6F0DAD|nr:GNAT family N-acetyltransferase [Mumia sp. zg.B53]MBW9216531.1 acetyltransferase [Mumia sp. zg.B53]
MSDAGSRGIAFRAMREPDLAMLVGWRSAPHVLAWFRDPPKDVDEARARYAERLAGEHPTCMWVVEVEGEPVGYVQDLPVASDDDLAVRVQLPGAVGFDYLIGRPDLIGAGLGTRMVAAYLTDVLLAAYPDARWFVACPDARNAASLRVLGKLGFEQRQWIQMPGEDYADIVCRLARDGVHRLLPTSNQSC